MIKIVDFIGLKMKFEIRDKADHQQKYWVSNMLYESQRNGLLQFLWHHRRKYQNKWCLDIGACIGNHTIFFAKALNCKVVAFEPQKQNFNHLIRNIELNGIEDKTTPVEMALGQKMGKIRMEGMSPDGHINCGMYAVKELDKNKEGVANITTLDEWINSAGLDKPIAFIKIDVEGYNFEVLNGAANTLKKLACDVFIECETGAQLKKTDGVMRSFGFYRDLRLCLNHTPTYLWQKE